MFRIYNVLGYVTLAIYLLACALIHPLHGDPWLGLGVGVAYFFVVWLVMGFYLGDVVHLGLAHCSLAVKPWFIYTVSIVANLIGIYLNPITWSNRHRLHHTFADHPGDPNKLDGDGFLKTCKLMLFPYPSVSWLATEPVFSAWPLRLVSNPVFAVFSQLSSYGLFALVVGDPWFALVPWCGMRLVATYIHIVQNYWTHDHRYGSRRYEDEDNARNIDNWLPVTLTFSACLQNNHHHAPRFVRLSHSNSEPDWGFTTVKLLCALGLARPTEAGMKIPEGAPLQAVGVAGPR